MKGITPGLPLKQRHKATRKSPVQRRRPRPCEFSHRQLDKQTDRQADIWVDREQMTDSSTCVTYSFVILFQRDPECHAVLL